MLFQFEQKNIFIDFLKQKANLLEIDVNSHKNLTIERMMKKIQPYIAYIQVEDDISNESKDELFNKLKQNIIFMKLLFRK